MIAAGAEAGALRILKHQKVKADTKKYTNYIDRDGPS